MAKGGGSGRKPSNFRIAAGVGCVSVAGFVFGGMLIEPRLFLSVAAAALAIGVVTALRRDGRVSGFVAECLSALSVLVCALFWFGWAYVEDWRVIPTTEYIEDHPGLVKLRARGAVLEEPVDIRFRPRALRVDGATSLRDCYRSLLGAVTGHGDAMETHGSRTPEAYESLVRGRVEAIFVFRPSRKQIADAAARGKEFRIIPIGYDAFVFFVNRDNPVDSLSVRQLRDVYSGKLTNWRQAGGPDEKVIPFQRYQGSGSQSRMERFMDGETLIEPEREHRFKTMHPIVAHVERYRNYRYAIGYSFLYYVGVMMEGGGVKLLRIDGVEPDAETIRDGSYPLSEEVCIVTTGDESRDMELFIDWVLSPQGQALIETIGLVPISPPPSGPERPKTRRTMHPSDWTYSATRFDDREDVEEPFSRGE